MRGKVAVACLLLAALTSCADSGGTAAPSDSATSTTQSGQTVTVTGTETKCPATHPRRLPVRIQTADEKYAATVKLIVACGDTAGQSVLLRNTSGSVWQVQSSGSSTRAYVKENLMSRSFRDTFGIETDILPPGQIMQLRRPASVSWSMDVTLTAAWLAHDYLVRTVAHGAQEAFTRNTPRRTAIVGCLLGLYQAYKQVNEPPEGQPDGLLAVWNIRSSAGSCGATWDAADAPGERDQKLQDLIEKWQENRPVANRTNEALSWMRKIGPLRSVLT
jgi:hypothetical protein